MTGAAPSERAREEVRFDEADQREIMEKIREKTAAPGQTLRSCLACGHPNTYSISDGFVFQVLQYTARALDYSAPGIPLVALVCRECGHTLFFNLLALGLKHLVDRAPRVWSGRP